MNKPAEKSASPLPPRNRARRRALLIVGPLLLVAIGGYLYLHGGRIVTSDNAYVHANKLTITSEVPGTVVEVAVRDNEPVTAGRLLYRLDDSLYRIRVDEARARLASVRTDLATLRATYRQKLTLVEEAKEQAAYAARELQRQETLASGKAGTEVDLDRAQHALELARKHIEVLQQDAATALAALSGDPDLPDAKSARVAAAQAELATAERNLEKVIMKAPSAGIVTNVSNLPIGKYLAAGQPAFSLVANDEVWIEANLKETDLTYLKVGDPVEIAIDTYPEHELKGQVEAIGPATGAEFALIPAQNAAGNWVKVVQRIPVRIAVRTHDAARPLRAGMSAEVRIDTGHIRTFGDLFGATRPD
jgi:membrane fusion protein (multidrug efflux system)